MAHSDERAKQVLQVLDSLVFGCAADQSGLNGLNADHAGVHTMTAEDYCWVLNGYGMPSCVAASQALRAAVEWWQQHTTVKA